MFMRNIDKHQDLVVSCMVTPSNLKFLLLHEEKTEDQIKMFFNEVYELTVKIVLSPFFDNKSLIEIPPFEEKVKKIANKYL